MRHGEMKCFLNSLGNGWAGTQTQNPHSQSVLHILSHGGDQKPKKKDKEINHGAVYCGLENSLTILNYHNNVKNDYYFLLFVRLIRKRAQNHRDKLQPLRNLFLLGVKHTNTEGIGTTTRWCQMCARNESIERAPQKEHLTQGRCWWGILVKAWCVDLGQTQEEWRALSLIFVLCCSCNFPLFCKCLFFYNILAFVLTEVISRLPSF